MATGAQCVVWGRRPLLGPPHLHNELRNQARPPGCRAGIVLTGVAPPGLSSRVAFLVSPVSLVALGERADRCPFLSVVVTGGVASSFITVPARRALATGPGSGGPSTTPVLRACSSRTEPQAPPPPGCPQHRTTYLSGGAWVFEGKPPGGARPSDLGSRWFGRAQPGQADPTDPQAERGRGLRTSSG